MRASWEREASVETAEECRRLLHDQLPFHLAEPEELLFARLIAADRTVYRPEVLRHFSGDGEYGLVNRSRALARAGRPVLVLSGALDRTTLAASAHELAQAIPGAREIVLERTAHFVPYEEPEAFLGALRAFLEAI